jgi:hypothetical protein
MTSFLIDIAVYVAGVATSAVVLKYTTSAVKTVEADAKAVNADVQADATEVAKKL